MFSVTPTVRSWIACARRSSFASNGSGAVTLRSLWAFTRTWRGEDDARFVEQLDGILHPAAPKKENGSGLEHPKPLYLN
jgi:hypothetical protein